MNRSVGMLAVGLLLAIGRTVAALNPEGVKCGDKRCSTLEYCSPYDKHCKPCSSICDVSGRNYQPLECVSDCQEYLHDKRYVLLKQYEDLRGEVGKLWIVVGVSIAVALLSLLSTFYLLAKRFVRWEKMRGAARRAFAGKWAKGSNNTSSNNNNNNNSNNKNNHRRSQEDAELGTSKPNGLKLLAMPTISASVAPSRYCDGGSGNGSGNGSGSASGSSSGTGSRSGTGNVTLNTTSTSLSGRHPSEDTTLDYVYDNPAMTPSPETGQLGTKRESSF